MTAPAHPIALPSFFSAANAVRALQWVRSFGHHGSWILGWAALSWMATIWSPALVGHPVLLMLFAPRAAFLVLAAPHVGFLPFVALGTARLAVTDASWYIVGKRFPDRTNAPTALSQVRWMRWTIRITTKLCAWLCSTAVLAAAVLFFRPNGRYLGIAGAHGVDSRLAGISSVLGTVSYLIAVHIGMASFFG